MVGGALLVGVPVGSRDGIFEGKSDKEGADVGKREGKRDGSNVGIWLG